MESAVLESKKFSAIEKIVYVILGALLTGVMWRARGSHGWGSEFGVMTVGLLLLVFIYSVFKRKTNASYFQIIAAATTCMLTTPAWGTLLHQTSGFFEVSVKGDYDNVVETFECTPWSGVFIMLCLGFGMMPLYMFMVSRLFSDKKYSLVKYIIVAAVFFGTFYIANATVSHLILNLVQPESKQAFEWGISYREIKGSAYEVYMKHFSDINWGKKVPFGRNYFTEIAVISHAIASLVTVLVLKFGFKDKAGAKVTFWGCTAFAIGITVANVFFVLEGKLASLPEYAWLDRAWSFWEFFTGFIAGLIIMIVLFFVNGKFNDEGFKDDILSFIPAKVKDVILCLFVFVFGFGVTIIRPFASRLDESDVLPIIVWVAGGIAILAFSVLMIIGKLPKMWNIDPTGSSTKLTLALFAVHSFIYIFVGYKESCLPAILEHTAIQYLMCCAVPLFLVGYILIKRKEIFAEK